MYWLIFVCLSFSVLLGAFTAEVENRPNIVLFLADDMGYGDVGCYGNNKVSTPNIDSLAKTGLTFTRMYSQPVCTPARAALLSGRQPVRFGLMRDSWAYLSPSWPVFRSNAQPGGLPCQHDRFLPTILGSLRYSQAMIGKWHLGIGSEGESLPMACGFNKFYGIPGSHCAACSGDPAYRITDHEVFVRMVSKQMPAVSAFAALLLTGVYLSLLGKKNIFSTLILYCTALLLLRGYLFLTHDNPTSCILMHNADIVEQPYKDENMTLRMTRQALEFIDHSVSYKVPFFLYMSHLQPHVPSYRSARFVNKSGLGEYYDSVMELDWSVGVVVDKLKSLGVYDNSLIIFASDNGPELVNPSTGDPTPSNMRGSTLYQMGGEKIPIALRGGKGTVWEGGIRVPAIFSWPGHIRPGSTSSALSSLMDVFPTVADLLDTGDLNRIIDGKSLLPVFKNPETASNHDFLMHYCDMYGVAAVSHGDYKVHYIGGPSNHSCGGVFLRQPLLYNIAADPGETNPLPVREHDALLNKIRIDVLKHQMTMLPQAATKFSQFSQFPRPWLFPCANFPNCQVSLAKEEMFDDLFMSSSSVTE